MIIGCSTPIDREKGDRIANGLYDYYATASAWRIVDPKLKSVLDQLRQNGLGVVVVSNFDGRLKEILQHLDLYHLFDMVVISGEVGVEKPNPKIFEIVLDHYHLPNACQLLHIGDNFEKDYQAARDFGARALLFDPLLVNQDVPSTDRITSFSELNLH
ncbi:hypothetical protein Y032_0008g236 [Ancylostoma ceylanicum]|uniref:HAD hydrolase, family IA, variant 1 n=1 Tax=Ancylostoma ceylanicum TaxID=53326 RepID=A0A016VKS1_9BILA|nr:hypothetical protein Y032_0008g236 [Ancylostoma ceylanicum]